MDSNEDAGVYAALVLGTRDYVRKCGFSKAIVGLSGGVDSALVAAIAVDALGRENVTGIGMPSDYSSTGSIDDARELAGNLGIKFELIPIRDLFRASAARSSLSSLAGSPTSPRRIFNRVFAAICLWRFPKSSTPWCLPPATNRRCRWAIALFMEIWWARWRSSEMW